VGKYTILNYTYYGKVVEALVLVGVYLFVLFYSDLFIFCIVWTINMSTERLRKWFKK